MKKTATTTLVLAIVILAAGAALIALSFYYGTPRVSYERFGMYQMRTYKSLDSSNLPLFFMIIGSALLVISCNLFLFSTAARKLCCKDEFKEECKDECVKDAAAEAPAEAPAVVKPKRTRKAKTEEKTE